MSIKIVNRYNSNEILHDSSNYPEFSGTLLKEFLEFLVNKNANLSYANLSYANLSYADLSNAKLSNANLSYDNLSPFSKWNVSFTLPFTIHIGCKTKTIKKWDIWFKKDTETFDHKRDSQQFKLIYANYLAVRSYLKEAHKQKLFHEIEVVRNEVKNKEWQVNW